MKSYMNPPEIVKKILTICLKLQAGINKSIKVNEKNDSIISDPWKGCMMMMSNPSTFVQICIEIFERIGQDPVLDRHIEEVKKKDWDSEKLSIANVSKISRACAVLTEWIKEVLETS